MHRAARTFRTASARSVLGVVALALVGACGRQSALDSGLNKDLVLADQLQQRNAPALVVPQDSAPVAAPASAPAPVREVVHTRVVTRTTTRTVAPAPARSVVAATPAPATGTQAMGSRPGSYEPGHAADGEAVGTAPSTGTDVEPAPAGTYGAGSYGANTAGPSTPVYRQPQAHAERDAIVGSIAGAIIGAAASHGNRVQGGLIGAVAGGALGAVYGHSADRTFPGYPTYAGTRTSRGYRASSGFVPPTYRSF